MAVFGSAAEMVSWQFAGSHQNLLMPFDPVLVGKSAVPMCMNVFTFMYVAVGAGTGEGTTRVGKTVPGSVATPYLKHLSDFG